MPCSRTDAGHATNLTGVKIALGLLDDPHRTPLPAVVTDVEDQRIILRLIGGTVEARCHDAERLAGLLDAAAAAGRPAPFALFTAHEHQLLVEVDNIVALTSPGTAYLSSASSTGAFAGFNLALPWHPYAPCASVVADDGGSIADAERRDRQARQVAMSRDVVSYISAWPDLRHLFDPEMTEEQLQSVLWRITNGDPSLGRSRGPRRRPSGGVTAPE